MRKRATRGRLRSSTHPNLNAHEEGRARSRSRDSRRAESPEAGSGDETEDEPPYTTTRTHQPRGSTGPFVQRTRRTNLHRTRGSLDASCPPLSTCHHRHLGFPRSAERHLQGSRDLGAHAGPLGLACAAARAQRALDGGSQVIARRRRFDEDIECAKTTAQEASLVSKRSQQALAQSVASAAAGATAAPPPSSRPQGVASQRPRPENDAFFKGIVPCMASAPRVDFSLALATAVVETACAVLASERPESRQTDVLPVEASWTRMDCTPYERQTRAAPTLALVNALLIAHDKDPDLSFG